MGKQDTEAELDDFELEDDPDAPCSWCFGEGVVEGSKMFDGLWYDPDKLHPCPACRGGGRRLDQTLF